MKTIYKFLAMAVTALVAVSCMIDDGGSSNRSRYALMEYSEAVLCRSYMLEPVLAVAIARTADQYLSLSEDERENFDISSIFPTGIKHMSPTSIYVDNQATIHSDGTSINTPGAKWKLTLEIYALTDWYSNAISFGSFYAYDYYTYYILECIDDGVWTITNDEVYMIDPELASGQIIIRLKSEPDGTTSYTVTVSDSNPGIDKASESLMSECYTSEDGIKILSKPAEDSSAEAETDDSYMPVSATVTKLTPVDGKFIVKFFKNGGMVDHCIIEYSENGMTYDVSGD